LAVAVEDDEDKEEEEVEGADCDGERERDGAGSLCSSSSPSSTPSSTVAVAVAAASASLREGLRVRADKRLLALPVVVGVVKRGRVGAGDFCRRRLPAVREEGEEEKDEEESVETEEEEESIETEEGEGEEGGEVAIASILRVRAANCDVISRMREGRLEAVARSSSMSKETEEVEEEVEEQEGAG